MTTHLPLLLPLALAATQLPQPDDPPGALPYDLAFGMASFVWDTEFSVSADGRFVAYDVRLPPADTELNLDERYQPNGTPSSAVGTSIHYTELSTRHTVDICPGGACWRPAWSPDGRSIAFFSDAGGVPQLWVHDIATGESRKLSDEAVKPKLWHGDEPRWSPDGSTLYVGFAPEGEFASPARPADVRVQNAAGVVVLRSGSEAVAAPGRGPAALADDGSLRKRAPRCGQGDRGPYGADARARAPGRRDSRRHHPPLGVGKVARIPLDVQTRERHHAVERHGCRGGPGGRRRPGRRRQRHAAHAVRLLRRQLRLAPLGRPAGLP